MGHVFYKSLENLLKFLNMQMYKKYFQLTNKMIKNFENVQNFQIVIYIFIKKKI